MQPEYVMLMGLGLLISALIAVLVGTFIRHQYRNDTLEQLRKDRIFSRKQAD